VKEEQKEENGKNVFLKIRISKEHENASPRIRRRRRRRSIDFYWTIWENRIRH
jgi:hypothetical protein